MKFKFLIAMFLLVAPAVCAQSLTVNATHLTMEQGQPVPPLIWTQTTYPTTCTGFPTISTTATSGSVPGTYSISISAGTFACTGYTISYTGSNVVVIADDGKGAQITPSVTYPPGFLGAGITAPAMDVTSNATCDLVGDGVTDNTSCLNTLLSLYMAASCSVTPTNWGYFYFPPGIYLVSNQINPCGNSWTFFGSGPQSSVIRLAPNSAAFNTGTNTQWFNPTSVSGNQNFREYIYNMGFDVGYGNPNAIPFTSEQNNVGAERNVIIWSEDGNCPYAVNLGRGFPGPAMFKNVALYGCVNAVYSNQPEYSWTFDQFTTEGQTGTVFNNGSLKDSIQHWLSDNTTTAMATTNNGGVSILDSELLNGGGSTTGITNASAGSLFARNVTVTGYNPSEVDTGTGTPVTYTGNLTQNWTGTASCLFCTMASSLYLTEQETPLPTDDPTQSNWTVLGTNMANWCSQISGSASVTVYAPPGTYSNGSGTYTCSVPDTVNHLEFYTARSAATTPKFIFTVAGTSSTPLVIDGCIYASCSVTHTGTRTVVITDTYTVAYTPSTGAGNAFLEDDDVSTYPVNFVKGQSIWARQFDLEASSGVNFTCTGCTLWILGYKTESFPAVSSTATLTSGAKVEIFTQFLYPLGAAGAGTFPMSVSNSSFFVAPTFEFVNVNGYGWQYWIQEQQGFTTSTLATPSQNSGDYFLNMYYSFGTALQPTTTGTINGGTLQ
jgi:hypothetical protein